MATKNEGEEAVNILSFDSGGPGTYSQLLILSEYMSRITSDRQEGGDDVYPADYFDLMGGVGFGGLAAVMLGHLRMSVDQAIDALLTIASSIFPEAANEKFDLAKNTQNLKDTVENMLQTMGIPLDTKMNDQRRPVEKCKVAIYAAASSNLSHARAFRTYAAHGLNLNPTLVEAICATMSVPSLFLPTKIGPRMRQQEFVGGVVGASNPTRELLNEAATLFGKDRRVAQIISVGAGIPRLISLDSSTLQTEVDQLRLLHSLVTDCEVVAKELSTRLFTVDAYLRLNVDRGMEYTSITDWSSLGSIESYTCAYLESAIIAEALEASLGRLRSRKGSITLGQLSHSSSIKISAKEVPAVSPYYVVRKAPWDSMVHHLVTSPRSRQRIFPITGMGGCGKTQLVAYFLQEHRQLYKKPVFVDASSTASIQSDLQTWARSLGDGHERDVWEDGLRILATVDENEHLALIFDNADDPCLNLVPFLPQNINLTIIVTSRNHTLGNLSTTFHLELAEMEDDEALLTLAQAARRDLPLPLDEEKCARKLADELGCLAVALVQAGRYCSQLSSTVKGVFRPYTFTQYLPLFYSHRSELMEKAEPSALDNYQRGAYTAFDLSYQATPQKARNFLHFMSFFHHTDIPLSALATAAQGSFLDLDYLPRPAQHKRIITALEDALYTEGKWNELQVQETIRILRSFSLLSVTSVDDSVYLQMHPLVQSWSRDRVISDLQLYAGMVVQVLASCCVQEPDARLHRALLPHILDIMARDISSISHVDDQMAIGRILSLQGKYQQAIILFTSAVEAMKDVEEKHLSAKTSVSAWLADTFRTIGLLDEAEELEVDILGQRKMILGLEHEKTLIAAANLARTYQSRGRLAESEELRVDVLEKSRRILGDEHRDTLTAAANLAAVYRARGRLAEAEELEIEVLEKRRRLIGLEHLDTISAVSNLASTYHSQGRWGESEKLKMEVLEQRQRILGIEHPDTILAQANLAATYPGQGRLQDHVRLLAPVVQLSLKVMGQWHPNTQIYIRHLAETYKELGREQEAEEMRLLVKS